MLFPKATMMSKLRKIHLLKPKVKSIKRSQKFENLFKHCKLLLKVKVDRHKQNLLKMKIQNKTVTRRNLRRIKVQE